MISSSFLNKPSLHSPPAQQSQLPQSQPERRPLEDAHVSVNQGDMSFRTKLGALAALALTLVPQAAGGENVTPEISRVVSSAEKDDSIDLKREDTKPLLTLGDEEMIAPLTQLLTGGEKKLEQLKSGASKLRQHLDPFGVLEKHSTPLGDYTLEFQGADFDISPKWRSGPALRTRGDFLETRISKVDTFDNGWIQTQGLNAKLRGELSTYDEPELDLGVGLFRTYEGSLGEDFDARLSFQVGVRDRIIGESEGMRAGFTLKQEVEGGNYSLLGQDFKLHAEGRQSLYYNFETDEVDFKYRFLAGPKKDFGLTLFGQDVDVSAMAGPEISGGSNEAVELGLGSKLRFRF